MFTVWSGIHAHFAHHVRGHAGPCISLHGHTWKLEVKLASRELDEQGFVVDFDLLHEHVLVPCFDLLDHALAIGEKTWVETRPELERLGVVLVGSRREITGDLGTCPKGHAGELGGARNEYPGGIKVAVFPFTPTSERLAEWLYAVTHARLASDRVSVRAARIYESLHPAEAVAEYAP
ncbi:MAG: 6-carboxytetrahydropterin synthase [Polyangiaceae bacterium]